MVAVVYEPANIEASGSKADLQTWLSGKAVLDSGRQTVRRAAAAQAARGRIGAGTAPVSASARRRRR
jgi:hypothetical protein